MAEGWTGAAAKQVGDEFCGPADGLDVGYAGRRGSKGDVAEMAG